MGISFCFFILFRKMSGIRQSEDSGPPEIDPTEVIFDKQRDLIGTGTYGKVYRGKCRGQTVAVKVPVRQNLTPKQLAEFRHEVGIMKRIFHPNVVLFLGACTEPGNFMLVTEYCGGGDMESILRSSAPLSIARKLHFAKDTALAMNWLHGINGILHRDLKPANLLTDENMRVKVTDFGFSQLKEGDDPLKDAKGPKGSALWMAPEVMMRKQFTEKIDVYAFGLILWEIWTRGVLFSKYDDFKPFIRAVTLDHERPPIPNDAKPSLAQLMEDCWHKDPEQRPPFKDIIWRLDQIYLDYAIQDDIARQFWHEHFFAPEQTLMERVKWRDFVKALGKSTGHSLVDIVALGSLFATDCQGPGASQEREVTIAHFNDMAYWFGPFVCPQRGSAILAWMKHLNSQLWFHGDIEREVAERRLLHRDDGTFLVRLSKNKPEHPFTISVMRPTANQAGCAPQHKRIRYVHGTGKWYAPVGGGTRCYNSLDEMLQDKECGLITPCPVEEEVNPYINTYLEDNIDFDEPETESKPN